MSIRRKPPRAPLRAVVALSLLLYCAMLLVPGSAAYFTSGAGGGSGSFGTANCSTLLQVPSGVTVQGLRGSGYNGFPVKITSTATVPLQLGFSYQGADPPTLSTYANTIPAGGTTTVYLSGTLQQTANGSLLAVIGNHFDTCAVSVSKTAVTYDIGNVVTLSGYGPFRTGEAAPKFEHVKVMTITQAPGQPSVPVTLSLSAWYVPYPPDGKSPSDPPTPIIIDSPTGTFSTSVAGTDVYLHEDNSEHEAPVYVTITVQPAADYVVGSQSYCFVMEHSGDKVKSCPATVPANAVYLSS